MIEPSITIDRGAAVEQATRVAALLDDALSRMGKHHPGSQALWEVRKQVHQAAKSLAEAATLSDADFGAAVLSAYGNLNNALARARSVELSPEDAGAVAAIEEAAKMLRPLAHRHGVSGPPPARRARPPEPPAEVVDRRETRRAFFESEVSFVSESNFYTGFTEDVSEGGLFVATYQLQPLGSEIDVEFTLPCGHTVRAIGVVRWVRDPHEETPGVPPGMGLQFSYLAVEDEEAVNVFIGTRQPIFFDDES